MGNFLIEPKEADQMELISTKTKNQLAMVEKLNDEVKGHAQAMVLAAIEMGRLLTDIKADCKRGEFMKLVQEHTTVGQRQANKYMRAYEHRDQLPSGTEDQLLSLTAFMDLIADKKPSPMADNSEKLRELADRINESQVKIDGHIASMVKATVEAAADYAELGEMNVSFDDVAEPAHKVFHKLVVYVAENAVEPDTDNLEQWFNEQCFNARIAHYSQWVWFSLMAAGRIAEGEFSDVGFKASEGQSREKFIESGKAISIMEWAGKFQNMEEAFDWMPPAITMMAEEFYERGLLAAPEEEA
jgi:hypothetical protein